MATKRKFDIGFRPDASDDLAGLKKYDQKIVQEAIKTQLMHQPSTETRNRKRLRPNELAEWELRVGKFRVFYDVDEENTRVTINAVGYKEGNTLYIHGEEYPL